MLSKPLSKPSSKPSSKQPSKQIVDLHSLMQKSGLWRASSIECEFKQGLSSGYPALDQHLPGAGWPLDGVTELLHEQQGIGELQLLSPALARLSREQTRHILMVSPPYIPYPPALHALGIDLASILVVQVNENRDMLWALEQALASKSCSAVLCWPKKINEKQIRRLQLASKDGNTWNILFRPTQAITQYSPAELRIHLSPAKYAPLNFHRSIHLKILKRRGGWESDEHKIDFDDRLNQQTPDFSELVIPSTDNVNHETKTQRRPMALPAFPATAG